MKARTARLSVGAAGLVVLWIVTYWWMDPAPTIRFDENASASRDREASPVTLSEQPVEVQPSRISDAASAPPVTQPPMLAERPAAVASSEVEPDRVPPQRIETRARLYTIRQGDLLSRIAQREYGSIRYTTFLYEHNRERLGLSSPDAIREGQVLEIPPLEEIQETGGGDV